MTNEIDPLIALFESWRAEWGPDSFVKAVSMADSLISKSLKTHLDRVHPHCENTSVVVAMLYPQLVNELASSEVSARLTALQAEISTSEKIELLIRLHVQTIIENRDGVSVANNEWKHLTEPTLSQFKHARRDYERGFATLIEQGIAEGVFQKVNVSVALFTILSAVRWVELWYKPERDISAQMLENDIVLMLLNGLKL